MFGNGLNYDNEPPQNDRYYTLNRADLVVPRMDSWRLYWDCITLSDLAKNLPDNSPLAAQSMEVANRITNEFDVNNLDSIATCRKLAEKVFGSGWDTSEVYAEVESNEVACWGISNCHIDTAWLWPYSCTRQKTARSWSSQIDLMSRYPEHRFVASQAQQFFWLEQDCPILFEVIKKCVVWSLFFFVDGE